MIEPSLAKLAHLEVLEADDLPYLIERRQEVYRAMDLETDPKQFARLWEMLWWATEQIVYLKIKYTKASKKG